MPGMLGQCGIVSIASNDSDVILTCSKNSSFVTYPGPAYHSTPADAWILAKSDAGFSR